MLAVIVQRRRADRLQLASSQRRLEDVGRVDRALRRARADQHVQLVNEQHAVARALDLLDHLLQPLLELAAVLRSRDQRTDVQRQQPLALQRLRHVARRNVLSQPFDHRRLAHARLADQHRIVLRPPRQNLNDPLNLLRSPDHRIQRPRPRSRGQVEAQLIDRRCPRRRARPRAAARACPGARRGWTTLRENSRRLRADSLQIDAQRLQHARRNALALADETQQ